MEGMRQVFIVIGSRRVARKICGEGGGMALYMESSYPCVHFSLLDFPVGALE